MAFSEDKRCCECGSNCYDDANPFLTIQKHCLDMLKQRETRLEDLIERQGKYIESLEGVLAYAFRKRGL